MVVLITNAHPEMVERFLDSGMARTHLAWIGITHGEITICLDESKYSICAGDEFITINSEKYCFTVYSLLF